MRKPGHRGSDGPVALVARRPLNRIHPVWTELPAAPPAATDLQHDATYPGSGTMFVMSTHHLLNLSIGMA